MPNAYVLTHHFGDAGTVSEGMILRDMASKRFEELKGRGLVREATSSELKAGYRPPFEREGDSGGALTALQQVESLKNELLDARQDADKAATDLAAATTRAVNAEQERDALKLRLAEVVDAKAAVVDDLDTARAELVAARAQIADLTAAAEKAAPNPANKQAPDPENKAGGKPADKAS